MPILNYTTSIHPEKTASEIQSRLARAKAQAILSEYDASGIMCAMSFRIMTPHGVMMFRLPANVEAIYRTMKNDPKVPRSMKTHEQASKVAWRILKDWVEAQLAIVESQMAQMAEVFLPYAQGKDGQTVYQRLASKNFEALTHSPESPSESRGRQ